MAKKNTAVLVIYTNYSSVENAGAVRATELSEAVSLPF